MQMKMADLPVLLATNKDEYRKPETGMWDFWVKLGKAGVEPGMSDSALFVAGQI